MAVTEVYEKVYEGISTMVRSGKFNKGEKLPSERELLSRFSVSRPTVNKAITRLVAEGVLYKMDGRKGTFVNHDEESAEISGKVVQNKLIKYVVPRNWGKFPVKHGVMEGLYSVASRHGLQTVLEYIEDKADWDVKVLNCDNRCLAGLVIWGHSFELNDDAIKELNESGIPYAIVDSMPECGSFNFVGTDNGKGAHMMVDYLYSMGHENICYVTEKEIKGSMKQRLSGFFQGMVTNDLEINSDSVLKIDETDENSFFTSIVELINKPNRPTAIFASHDRFLVKIYEFLNRLNINCPGEISLAGYDDIDISAYMPVPLTTVKQDFYKMGKLAVELILKENSNTALPQKILLEPELVVRSSTGKLGEKPKI